MAIMKKAVAKKAVAKKSAMGQSAKAHQKELAKVSKTVKKINMKPSASAMSAKPHQQDLARISGGIAQSKDKKFPRYDAYFNPYHKAESKTRKSFGLKNKRKSEY